MWTCPQCSRKFAQRKQQHACGRWTVAERFAGRPAALRALFDAFVKLLRSNGPVRLHPTKTRIGVIARMTFANMTVMQTKLRVGLILTRRVDSPRWVKVERYSPRCFGHYFNLTNHDELDDELRALAAEAYQTGRQLHLAPTKQSHCRIFSRSL
jgi:hypothetical protein